MIFRDRKKHGTRVAIIVEHELLGEQPGTEAVAALGEGLPHDGRVHCGGGCLRLD